MFYNARLRRSVLFPPREHRSIRSCDFVKRISRKFQFHSRPRHIRFVTVYSMQKSTDLCREFHQISTTIRNKYLLWQFSVKSESYEFVKVLRKNSKKVFRLSRILERKNAIFLKEKKRGGSRVAWHPSWVIRVGCLIEIASFYVSPEKT